jgi:hypothetical protein
MVGDGAEQVVPPAADSFVTVVAALHASGPRNALYAIVGQRQTGVEVPPVERVEGSVG